jgi:ATP-binding cassette subfamily F protein uup
MNLLSVENLTKSYGEKTLFTDISFGIQQGQRIALVARNGSGKTTLLNILQGTDIADSGKVVFRNGISVAFLQQQTNFNLNETVYNALFNEQNESTAAIKKYELAIEKHNENPCSETETEIQNCIQRIDNLGIWDYESRIKQILTRLKITKINQPLKQLSGGQQKRVALAKVLIDEPQLLIMDEPTNHLDLEMIEWLENYFVRKNVSLLLVTHDRYFLDNVCTDIIELDNASLYFYKGNYAYFIEKKAERELNQQSELDRARNIYRRELEWIRKMPKARGTKSKSRVDAFYDLENKVSGTRKQDKLQLSVKMNRIGGKILELKKVYKSFNNQIILKGFDYTFKTGERIGIIGNNGTGKSTFLNLITGQQSADSGKINVGETVVYGYYSQQGMLLNNDKRVIEVIKEIADFIPLADGTKVSASQMLQMFQFKPDMQYTYVSKLSGGEKKRLYLLTVLMKNPNFLILDEPTNDLDLITLAVLEQFLLDFKGCLIVVSHDRYFMDKLVDRLFIFEGNGHIKIFEGTYSQYRDEHTKEQEPKVKPDNVKTELKTPTNANTTKIKISYKDKYEFELLEKEIPDLEKKKAALSKKLEEVSNNHIELIKVSEELSILNAQLDEKILRWIELEELIKQT